MLSCTELPRLERVVRRSGAEGLLSEYSQSRVPLPQTITGTFEGLLVRASSCSSFCKRGREGRGTALPAVSRLVSEVSRSSDWGKLVSWLFERFKEVRLGNWVKKFGASHFSCLPERLSILSELGLNNSTQEGSRQA